MNLRAALYARVSTEGQRDEQTIESQVAETQERIKADGDVLISDLTFIDDGWSGELLERPALDKMRDAAARNEFDVLYVYDRGRLARKFAYQELILEEIKDRRIEFVTLHDIKAETPEEQVLQMMQGVFHEYERVKITERFRRGKLYKVKNGNLLGYNACYGYTYTSKTKELNGFFTVKENEAAVVSLIFEWFTAELLSIRGIMKRLYQEKILSPKDCKTWGKGTLGRLLTNETYAGKHYYYKSEAIKPRNPEQNQDPIKKYRRTKKTSRRYRPKEEWLPVDVPAIISRSTFEKAQRLLTENKMFSRRNAKLPYLLTGVIYCPCGQRRTGQATTGAKHRYYRCIDRIKKFPVREHCRIAGVNGTVLDAVVWNEVIGLLTNPRQLRNQAQRWVTQESSTQQEDLKKQRMDKELEQLQRAEERYTRAYGEGAMPLSLYKQQMTRVTKKRAEIEAQTAKETGTKPDFRITAKELEQVAKEVVEELNFDDKKTVIRKLVTKVVADQEKVEILGHIPVPSKRYVELSHADRNRGFTQRRQVDAV